MTVLLMRGFLESLITALLTVLLSPLVILFAFAIAVPAYIVHGDEDWAEEWIDG